MKSYEKEGQMLRLDGPFQEGDGNYKKESNGNTRKME